MAKSYLKRNQEKEFAINKAERQGSFHQAGVGLPVIMYLGFFILGKSSLIQREITNRISLSE